jgi:hypothetical protein
MPSDQLDLDPGFVNRPASRDRAEHESRSGIWSNRKALILSEIMKAGSSGLTWRDLSKIFPNLHHGQISGALSKLHQEGKIFALRVKRDDRCHPYIDESFRHFFDVRNRFDHPIKTQTSRDAEIGREVRRILAAHPNIGAIYFTELEAHDRLMLTLDAWLALIDLRKMVEDTIETDELGS